MQPIQKAMRRAVLVFSLVLAAAAPASGDELIRYRAADGTLGLVDKPEKLPPGAEVLERTPLAEDRGPETHAERAAATRAAAGQRRGGEEAGDDGGAQSGADDGSAAADAPPSDAATAQPYGSDPGDSEQEAEVRTDPATCVRLGLSVKCDADSVRTARRWCVRGVKTQQAIEAADAELEAAQESYEDCRTANGSTDYCSRDRLDAAEGAVADSQGAFEQLQESCRLQECLPGWIRESCNQAQ